MEDKSRPIKLAVLNQKGGVAKTTTVFNMAGILAKAGYKVLVIDCDPQANITKSLLHENINEYDEEHGTIEGLLKEVRTLRDIAENPDLINDTIIKAKICIRGNFAPKWRGIDIIPSNSRMLDFSVDEDDEEDGPVILEAINKIRRTRKHAYDYDFILFDLPPQISDVTFAALSAVNYLLVPATADSYSLSGYTDLIDTVHYFNTSGRNPSLKIIGVFFSMIQATAKYDRDMYADVRAAVGEIFIDTPIRLNSNAKLAASLGCPLCWLKPSAGITRDYINVTEEVLRRCGKLERGEELPNMAPSRGSDLLKQLGR